MRRTSLGTVDEHPEIRAIMFMLIEIHYHQPDYKNVKQSLWVAMLDNDS